MMRWSKLFAGALCLAAVSTLIAADKPNQTPVKPDEPRPAGIGHLEVPDDPYVYVPRESMPRSRGAVIQRGGYISYQVNVDALGNNIVGDAANEPSIAVNPNNPTQMAIGWRQFDTITNNHRQAGVGFTTDAGMTWTFPGPLDAPQYRSDPVLGFDAQGNFYYNSLTRDPPQTNFHCDVFKSTDGGQTWQPFVYAFGGDKQWMTLDRSGGIGDGNIYACWNISFSACSGHFTRSTDGGQSFVGCTSLPGTPYWGTLSVGPAGELYVSGAGFQVSKSTNVQDPSVPPASWSFSTGTVSLGGSIDSHAGPNPGGLLGQAWIATDHSGGPTHGNVYLLCSVDPPGSDPLDVHFTRSTDGGQTWSTPVRVNDDPTSNGAWQWFGTMSVAPNGRIDAVWADTRNDPGGYDSELYYSYSDDGGVTWAPNVTLGPPWDPHVGWPQQNKIGDYYDMVSDDWGAHLAYSATYNGEQDVYYLRIGDPPCPSDGRLNLDSEKYACESVAELVVIDCDLDLDPNTLDTVDIAIDSDSEPAGEILTLTETFPASARFEGSITLSGSNAPGVLLVAEGDLVTATYIDADNGQGGQNVIVTDTAVVDCTEPVIFNVQVAQVNARDALITFETDEPAAGAIDYGLSCGALVNTVDEGGYTMSHSIQLNGLNDQTTYYFAVAAEDEAGNLAFDNNAGGCYTFTTPDVPNFFTEQFNGAFDLDNKKLSFIPNGSNDFYLGCVEDITSLPTDPTGGTAISLGDDDSQQITPSQAVYLYGTAWNSLFVGSNGYLTFGTSDTDYTETFEDHFDTPRVSGLFDDLRPPSGGTISWKELADRVVVTFENVPEYYSTGSNTFQYELFFDGTITISYLGITCTDAIVGLSDGNGLDPQFLASDLSTMGPCAGTPPTAYDGTAQADAQVPVTITLNAIDDGLPNPPGMLTYVIDSLPANGTLSDPNDGDILSAPYTLLSGGNEVVYTSGPFVGDDVFTFRANDGGTPPDGGDSNVATITVTVVAAPELIYSFPLDTDPGWSTTANWAFGVPTGGGTHNYDPSSGYTGSNVYGYNLAGDYESNMAEEYLTTTAINCAGVQQTQLRFRRWLGVEDGQFDHARIDASSDGVNWNPVWDHTGGTIAETAWSYQTYDISDTADGEATVYIRWTMGPTDGSVTYPGWNIDDVEIWGIPPFFSAGDCNCDGALNAADIDPFVLALTDPAGYATAYPNCDRMTADANGDGVVNASDIDPFVMLIVP